MASPASRRVVTQRSLERQNSKGDDPWCLTCGVNLALDGRTYSSVSRHNNTELCDIFSRVLGAEFSPDYASINVCNRCERQLRRLGRYNSIILARHEGEKLREQLEKNLAKHGQKVIESGHRENPPSPTSPPAATKPSKSDIFSSSFGKSLSYEGHSGIRKTGKYSSRSVGSVHFEDEREAARRESALRKYSAPEGVRTRESLSLFSEGERRREARRRKWSSASSTSEETIPASPTSSANRSLIPRGRGVALTTHPPRDGHQTKEISISSDLQQISDHLTTENTSIHQDSVVTPVKLAAGDSDTMEEETVSSTDKAALLENNESFDQPNEDNKHEKRRLFSFGRKSSKSADSNENKDTTPETAQENTEQPENTHTKTEDKESPVQEDNSQAVWAERTNPFDNEKQDTTVAKCADNGEHADDDVFVSGADTEKTLPRMDTIQADDELFTKLGSDLLKDDPQDSESPTDVDPDPSDFSADNRSNLSEVEERISTKTKFKGAYYNIGSTEDLLQEFANEEIREKARWSKLTFTESVDVGDAGEDSYTSKPSRPPRRSRSGRSSLKARRETGTASENTSEQGAEDKGGVTTREQDGTTDRENEVKVNGIVLEKKNESAVTVDTGNEDGSAVATFDKDAPEATETQAAQEGATSTKKSEKSPLIGGKNLRLKNGLKNQFPGVLCCSIL